MSTEIALDTLKASSSIKDLSQAVKGATSAWKSQEAMLKSTGDYLNASKAKYEGLGNVIQSQESKLEALKAKQAGLNTSTKDGALQYSKYQEQIDKANVKLNSLHAQQEKAKTAMETQKSGVIGLNTAMRNQETVLNSLVGKLEAEGKHEEALKAQKNGLKEATVKQNALLKKEQELLAQTAEKSGKASTAYANQAKRVNDLGAKMAHTKTKISEIDEELGKTPKHGLFSGIINQIKDTSKQEDKLKERTAQVHDRIKSIVSGTAIISGLQTVGNGFKSIAEQGFEGAKAATVVASRLKNIGASDKDVNSMAANMKDLKENTALSGDSVAALETKFYSMTGSADKANKLAKGVGSITDNLKLSGPQADAFAGGLSRIYASGKVTSQSLARLGKQAPGLSNALQKASGKSADEFKKLVASGKMTSDQFNDLLNKASESYGKNKDTFNQTSDGALKHIKQSWADTKTALMKPLVSVEASGLSSLSKALDNKETQSAVDKLGKTIAQLAGKVADLVNYITAHRKDISSIVSSLVQIIKLIGGTVWSMFAGTIKTIGAMFGSMSDKASKSKEPLDKISSAFKAIASHKTAIKGITTLLVTGIFGAKVLGGAVTLGKNIAVAVSAFTKFKKVLQEAKIAQTAFDVVANMNPFGAIVIGITAVVAGFVLLYKHSAKFRKFVNDIGKSAKECWKTVTKWFKLLWKDTVGAIQNMYKGVTGWFGNMKNGMIKHTSEAWKNTKNTFSDGIKNVGNWTKDHAKNIANKFGDMKNWTTNHTKEMWKNNKGTFHDGYNVLTDYTRVWSDIFHGKWSNVSKDLQNLVKDMSKLVKGIFKGMYDEVNKLTGGRLGDVLGKFRDIFGKIKDVVSDAIEGIHHNFVGITRGIIKPFNELLSGIKKGINWILDKVGMDKIKASWSIPLPAYAQGTKDTHQGGLALVNDGQGANYREMYQLPSGEVGMFGKERNMIVPLPKGTSILDGDKSANFAKLLGIPAYKGGIGSFFSGIWDKGKDLLEDADKILAHPIDFLSGVFNKMIGGLSSKVELAQDLITGLPKTVAHGATKWIKSLFDDVGSASNPGGSGVQRWKDTIKKAAEKMHVNLTGAGMNAVLHRIAQESNGNPTITNNWDSNAKAGTPSKGLLQYIQPTLTSWVPRGVKADLASGWAQLVALFNDSNWLADISVKGGWGPTGHKRMANGGLVSTNQMIEVAEGNKKEMVIPLELQEKSRAWELVGKTIAYLTRDNNANLASTSAKDSEDIRELQSEMKDTNNKLDSLIELMKTQIRTTANSAFSKDDLYRKQASDQRLANMQQLN